MRFDVKAAARNIVPKRYEVPAKYYYNSCKGTLEREMKLLGKIVRERDLVLDVGANRGIYTFWLWRLGAKIEVFEPNPSCHGVIACWASNKMGVNTHPVALSNHAGQAILRIPVDESGLEHDASASIENVGFARARDERVSLRTLDSFGFHDVTLIKIDVEGHESSVIEGGAATLSSSRPALLVEIEQRHNGGAIDDVFQLILGFKYKGFFLQKDRLRQLGEFDLARDQSIDNFGKSKGAYINNFLFLHRERLVEGAYNSLFQPEFMS